MPGDGISAASLPDRETLKLLAQRSNWSAMVRVVSHFGSVLAMGALIFWVIAAVGILWALPLVLMQGWLVGFLFMPLHETAHKTAFKHQKANLVIGNICAVAVVLPYEYYTLFHWAHHRHTQDPKHDPELAAGLPAPASVSGLAIWFLGVRQLIGRFKLIARHAMTGRVTAPWVPAGKRDLVTVDPGSLRGSFDRIHITGNSLSFLDVAAALDHRPNVPASLLAGRTFRLRERARCVCEHPHDLHGQLCSLVYLEHALSHRASRLSQYTLSCSSEVA